MVLKSMVLFALAAVLEIGGAWLVWQGVREHRGWAFVGAGVIALGCMIGADHRHPGKFALRPSHWRQRYRLHSGHFLQHLLQVMQAGQKTLTDAFRR